MLVTKLEKIDQKRIKVYIDYEYAFLLYSPDIRRYRIEEEKEVSKEEYSEIIQETIYRRAKQKALAILKYMDRTENELAVKLKQAFYNDEIISRTIEYVKSYHYIDDERYAANYIAIKKNTKSKKQIQNELYRKGIDKVIVEQSLENLLKNDDIAIRKAIRKKTDDSSKLTSEQRLKIIASLYRKGFAYEDIMRLFWKLYNIM